MTRLLSFLLMLLLWLAATLLTIVSFLPIVAWFAYAAYWVSKPRIGDKR